MNPTSTRPNAEEAPTRRTRRQLEADNADLRMVLAMLVGAAQAVPERLLPPQPDGERLAAVEADVAGVRSLVAAAGAMLTVASDAPSTALPPGQRHARPGEACTCGQPAVVVAELPRFGDVARCARCAR